MEKYEFTNIFDFTRPEYKIKNEIKLIELFSGYGSQALALKYLGIDFVHHRTCEWAIKSIQAYNDLHIRDYTDYSQLLNEEQIKSFLFKKGISTNYNEPMTKAQIDRLSEHQVRTIYNNIVATHNLVNIQQVHAKDLGITNIQNNCYIMTYSFPCFTGENMVLTSKGYKPIKDIQVGELVLSHDNSYHKVVNIFNNGIHDVYKIIGAAIDEIKTTYNHKFYVRTKHRVGHKQIRVFDKPIWKETKDLTKNDYLGIAINQKHILPKTKNLPVKEMGFWWLIGRFIGDGWVHKHSNHIIVCCDKKETKEITDVLDTLWYNYKVYEERTVNKIFICSSYLKQFCLQFGCGAINKHITHTILDLPIKYLKSFIDGYISADGSYTQGYYKATSVSRKLIYGLGQCVAKVYKTPYRIYKVNVKPQKTLENRVINQHTQYQIVYKTIKHKQDKAFYEKGYIWFPISKIEYVGQDNVYDIEVENSHSFTIQNTIVHNCQDLSLAGNGKGMEKGSGTRSGMLWEVERILKECIDLPQILLMENVPQVHSQDNVKDFNEWQLFLESLGYCNYWEDLNAKDYGIPQNRNRTFMISILGDYNYKFPQPGPLKLKLKDMLEQNVDEKYYLSDKMVKYISQVGVGNYANNNSKINLDIARPLTTVPNKRAGTTNYIGKDLPDNYDLSISDNLKENTNIKEIVNLYNLGLKRYNRRTGVVLSPDGVMTTLLARTQGDNSMIAIKNNTQKGYLEATDGDGVDISGRMQYHRGTVQKDMAQTITTSQNNGVVVKDTPNYIEWEEKGKLDIDCRAWKENAIAPTTTTTPKNKVLLNNLRIRKLTPKECWRLMGVRDEDYENVAKNQSNASLYHLAGDSIVVNVLMAIFKQLL